MVKHRPARLSEPELRAAATQPLTLEELLLGAGCVLPPLAWALQFALSYGLVYPALHAQSKSALHGVAVAAAVVCAAGSALGWRGVRRSRLGSFIDAAQRDRTYFMGVSACVLGGFFVLAIAAQSAATGVLSLGGHP
jgi:hypothetical protein